MHNARTRVCVCVCVCVAKGDHMELKIRRPHSDTHHTGNTY